MSSEDKISSLAEVQRLLLPDQPLIRGLSYATHYQPAEIAAGDYYDLMALPDETEMGRAETGDALPEVWGVMLGDVSGHGPAAAMEAVQFDAILRTYRGDEPPGGPAGALTYANRYYFSRRPRPFFMTVFAALNRPAARELDYVSAGHPPALLRRGSELLRLGDDGDIPLGITREHRYSNSTCAFLPGDLLIAYTDGLPEATNPAGEAFGFERIERLVMLAPPEPAALLDALRAALIEHQRSDLGHDDQTIVVLQQTA
jgi:sigma-B regulation protein RsbU (phosphoserine phosphatase)